jgi:hypothetical protein
MTDTTLELDRDTPTAADWDADRPRDRIGHACTLCGGRISHGDYRSSRRGDEERLVCGACVGSGATPADLDTDWDAAAEYFASLPGAMPVPEDFPDVTPERVKEILAECNGLPF